MIDDVLLDTNILVYSIDSSSSLHKESREILNLALKGDFNAFLSYQNLNEFLRIVTSTKFSSIPLSLKEGIKSVNFFMQVCKIIYPTEVGFRLNLDLAGRYKIGSAKIFDTMLVATMLEYGIFKVYTNNIKDFSIYEEIVVVSFLR